MSKRKSKSIDVSRRQLFQAAGAGTLITAGAASQAFAARLPAPRANVGRFRAGKFPRSPVRAKGRVLGANDRILVGHVGLGGMGTAHLRHYVRLGQERNTQSIAVSDVYRPRQDRGRSIIEEGTKEGCATVTADKDYRRMLENKDVDAIMIATPEHWHSQIAVHAMEAGKHVYIEKPMSRYLDEAFQIEAAARRTGKVVQVGANRTSNPEYLRTKQIVEQGQLGPLVSVQTSYARNSLEGEWNYKIEEDSGPHNLDWDMWLGSAPRRPWNADSQSRFFRYRKYRDYSAGILGDLMPHLVHPILMAVGGDEFPSRVSCIGTREISTDREVADTVTVTAEFPRGWTFIFVGSTVNEQGIQEMVRGHQASLYLSHGELRVQPERPYAEEIEGGPESFPGRRDHSDHQTDFLNAIRTGSKPTCNIDVAVRAQTLVSLAEMSLYNGKTMSFDAKRRTWKPT